MTNINSDVLESFSTLHPCTSTDQRTELHNEQFPFDQLYDQDDGNHVTVDSNTVTAMDIDEINEVVIEETDTEQAEHNDIDDDSKNAINTDRLHSMFTEIQKHSEWASKWAKTSFQEFQKLMCNKWLMSKLPKRLLLLCYDIFKADHAITNLNICKSWPKT